MDNNRLFSTYIDIENNTWVRRNTRFISSVEHDMIILETNEAELKHSILFVPRWFCDGKDCDGYITGTKFKCTVCDDFDLCLGCQMTKNWPPR